MADSPLPPALRRLDKLVQRFLAMEASGGVVMIVFAVLAVIIANSPLAQGYQHLTHLPIGVSLGSLRTEHGLAHWVADLLMAFFFLTVGMELKREMREGFLRERSQIFLPLAAAAGGMAAPALIFAALNWADPVRLNGWATPAATDIAFALAVLLLCGKKVPASLKTYLLAIAIFDDLGAILIIALFYSGGLNMLALAGVAVCCAVLLLLNRLHVRHGSIYLLVGAPLWLCMYLSGIHATLAGVIVGFAVPMRIPGDASESPLNRFLHHLHPWVSFAILPLFAFTSAGVDLSRVGLHELALPVPLGIALGLFLGKQVGVFGVTWLLIKLRLVAMPEGAGWMQLYGVAVLAGIGFTMSLFIGFLAYADPLLHDEVRLGVLSGSLISAIWGAAVLTFAGRVRRVPETGRSPS